MNARERFLASLLVVLLVVVGGAVGAVKLYVNPLDDYDTRIVSTGDEVAKLRLKRKQTQDSMVRLARYRQLSLPADSDRARREYVNYLNATLIKSGFSSGSFKVASQAVDARGSSKTLSGKRPIYTKLAFTTEGTARLESVVRFLEEFYRTPLLHQVKELSLTRSSTPNVPRPGVVGAPAAGANAQKQQELTVHMKFEALILSGANHLSALLPNIDPQYLGWDAVAALTGKTAGLGMALWAVGPTGPHGPALLARPPRNYRAILDKDIFFGPPKITPSAPADELDYTQFVFLTDITRTPQGTVEATLHQWHPYRNTKVRTTPGHNRYRLLDDKGRLVVQANVVKILDQDVILQVDEQYYSLHVGHSLADALEKPLSEKQVEALLKERVNARLEGTGGKAQAKN